MNIKNIFFCIFWILISILISTIFEYIGTSHIENNFGGVSHFYILKTGVIIGLIASAVQLFFYRFFGNRKEKEAFQLNLMRFLDLLMIILGISFVYRLFV